MVPPRRPRPRHPHRADRAARARGAADRRGTRPGGIAPRPGHDPADDRRRQYVRRFARQTAGSTSRSTSSTAGRRPRSSRCASGASRRPASLPRRNSAVEAADVIVIAPSNPIVSTGPILALPGVREALSAAAGRGTPIVAVSGIVGGRALRGPADRMLASLGHEPTALGVARIYAGIADRFVLDAVDRELATEIETLGMRTRVTDTVMTDDAARAALPPRSSSSRWRDDGTRRRRRPGRAPRAREVAARRGARCGGAAGPRVGLLERTVAPPSRRPASPRRSSSGRMTRWQRSRRGRGARHPPADRGLNHGLARGRSAALDGGATAVLVLPIDLPAVSPAAVSELLGVRWEARPPLVASSPTATAAARTSPPRAAGRDRVRVRRRQPGRPCRHAAAAALDRVVELDGPLSLDIDTPEDLLLVQARELGARDAR